MVVDLLAERRQKIKIKIEHPAREERSGCLRDVQYIYRNVSLPSLRQKIQE